MKNIYRISRQVSFVIFVAFIICSGGVLLNKSGFFQKTGQPTVTFTDSSVLVEYNPHHPKVVAPSVSLKELLSQARIKKMRERRAKAKEHVALWQGIQRPTATVVNPATYGGKYDYGVTANEPAIILGVRARDLDVTKDYIVWFMPDYSEDNPESPVRVPSVERFLGGSGSLKERIGEANKKMKDYLVEVTSLDGSGRVIAGPFYAIPVDRGPSTRFENPRIDLTIGLAKKLKIEDALSCPNSDENRVNLVVRLVHKSDVETLTEAVQFSHNGGEKFVLPSWEADEEKAGAALVAKNP